MKIDLLIIGGGAAGLFAAAVAAKQYKERGETPSVLVLEKMERCGRKIALTGKGRCNLTNTKPWEEFARHIHPKNVFLKNAFYGMSNTKTMEFFEQMGLPLVTERGDRVFPQSMRAMDVTQAMLSYATGCGVRVMIGVEVTRIEFMSGPGCEADGRRFRVGSNDLTEPIFAKSVILATGGLSYPTTGSTGDGYVFAKQLGHKITTCFPSLTALTPKNYRGDLQGISLKNVSVQLLVNKDVAEEEFGDLDFTNGGIEGPVGFKVSRKGVWSLLNGQKVEILLDMKPAVTAAQLKERIARELADAGVKGGGELNFILPKLLPKNILKPFTAMQAGLTVASLPQALKSWKFEITSYVGYERCVITAGGVSLEDVSQKTLESKRVKGLYFAGEVLDLDGDTGGYNLQIAFSTAALAAVSAIKQLAQGQSTK